MTELTDEIERHLRLHVSMQPWRDAWELFLLLRCTSLRLLDAVHREYLGPHYADSLRPALLHLDCLPPVSIEQLAEKLAGIAANREHKGAFSLPLISLQEAFNRLCRADREILAMRHFEQLTRDEVSKALHLTICRASGYYLTAVRRLRHELNRPVRFHEASPFKIAQPAAVAVG
jgi:RNA polymerase sigma-70 factor (ECF subfamily)